LRSPARRSCSATAASRSRTAPWSSATAASPRPGPGCGARRGRDDRRARRWVTPGLFSALTDLGLWDVEEVDESNDTEADDSPFGAALDVARRSIPASQHVAVSRAGGVTRASVAGARGLDLRRAGRADRPRRRPRRGDAARARSRWSRSAERGAEIAGGSRVAAWAAFHNALAEAQALAASTDRDNDVLLNRPTPRR
jgi:hypothetical protein